VFGTGVTNAVYLGIFGAPALHLVLSRYFFESRDLETATGMLRCLFST
jgi:hypothetical protein